jgi:hypothetical protein
MSQVEHHGCRECDRLPRFSAISVGHRRCPWDPSSQLLTTDRYFRGSRGLSVTDFAGLLFGVKRTETIAKSMREFNTDSSWQKSEEKPQKAVSEPPKN